MGIKTEQVQIDDSQYTIVQWPAEKSFIMKLKLMKVFKPLISAFTNMDGDFDLNKLDLESVIGGILEKENDPEKVFNLIKSCLIDVLLIKKGNNAVSSKIDSNNFNSIFENGGSDIPHLYKLFFEVLKVNYGGFFDIIKKNNA